MDNATVSSLYCIALYDNYLVKVPFFLLIPFHLAISLFVCFRLAILLSDFFRLAILLSFFFRLAICGSIHQMYIYMFNLFREIE
jgi:uncharacterized protein YqhQ